MSRQRRQRPPNSKSTQKQISVKVAIGYCHGDLVSAYWHSSLIGLIYQEAARVNSIIAVRSGPKIDDARNEIFRQWLRTENEYLLMVDTDMVLPKYTLSRLLSAHKDIVSALAFVGSFDGAQVKPNATVIVEIDGKPSLQPLWNYPADSLVQVAATGASCMLIHRRVAEDMLAARGEDHPMPWFAFGMHNGVPIGEDIGFGLTAAKVGYETWVDTGIIIPHVKPRFVTDKDYVLSLSNESHPYYNDRDEVPIYQELMNGNSSLNSD